MAGNGFWYFQYFLVLFDTFGIYEDSLRTFWGHLWASVGRNGWKWFEMARNGWNGWKWLEITEISGNGLKNAENGWNGWQLLEMAGRGQKGLE